MPRIESLTTARILEILDERDAVDATTFVPAAGNSTVDGVKTFMMTPTVNGDPVAVVSTVATKAPSASPAFTGAMSLNGTPISDLLSGVLLLSAAAPIPGGTPAGTIIARTP